MKYMAAVIWIFMGGLLLAEATTAQDLIIYPNKGQSQEQMNKDKSACRSWAQDQSGYNPAAPPTAASPPPTQTGPQGGAVRGAARGALVGVTVGAIAGDAGKGAAMGAAGGGLLGGMRQRDHQKQAQMAAQQKAQQQAAAAQKMKDTYNRAYEACLEAKGYTVK
jgi:hypothetical protein